jgi:flagellar biosynthesis chaperone FliJ
MARFVFELQAALEQREREERNRQMVVAQLQRESLEIEDAIRRTQTGIVREKEALRDALRAERAGGLGGVLVDLDAARRQGAATLGKIREAQQAAIKLAGVLKRLDSARLDLLEAARERKAVELLRDRRYEAWKRDQMCRETAESDELAVMRAGRRDAPHDAPHEARGDAA